MKAVTAADTLMACPDHNSPFEVCTDASDCEVGACIMQQGRPVAHHSKKLTKTQQNCHAMEKELSSIALTSSKFRTMPLGADLHVHTDRKNLMFETLNSSRVLRWRIFLEECGAKCHCIEGKNNVLADAFRPTLDSPSRSEGKSAVVDEASLFMDAQLRECFLN